MRTGVIARGKLHGKRIYTERGQPHRNGRMKPKRDNMTDYTHALRLGTLRLNQGNS